MFHQKADILFSNRGSFKDRNKHSPQVFFFGVRCLVRGFLQNHHQSELHFFRKGGRFFLPCRKVGYIQFFLDMFQACFFPQNNLEENRRACNYDLQKAGTKPQMTICTERIWRRLTVSTTQTKMSRNFLLRWGNCLMQVLLMQFGAWETGSKLLEVKEP